MESAKNNELTMNTDFRLFVLFRLLSVDSWIGIPFLFVDSWIGACSLVLLALAARQLETSMRLSRRRSQFCPFSLVGLPWFRNKDKQTNKST